MRAAAIQAMNEELLAADAPSDGASDDAPAAVPTPARAPRALTAGERAAIGARVGADLRLNFVPWWRWAWTQLRTTYFPSDDIGGA